MLSDNQQSRLRVHVTMTWKSTWRKLLVVVKSQAKSSSSTTTAKCSDSSASQRIFPSLSITIWPTILLRFVKSTTLTMDVTHSPNSSNARNCPIVPLLTSQVFHSSVITIWPAMKSILASQLSRSTAHTKLTESMSSPKNSSWRSMDVISCLAASRCPKPPSQLSARSHHTTDSVTKWTVLATSTTWFLRSLKVTSLRVLTTTRRFWGTLLDSTRACQKTWKGDSSSHST